MESDQEIVGDGKILRRSPSAGSEVSYTSTTVTSTSEDDAKQSSKITSTSSVPHCANGGNDLPKNSFGATPSNGESSSKNDESKSFLIRALGPVTNLFKSKVVAQSQSVVPSPPTPPRPDIIYADDGNNSTSISENMSQDTASGVPATKTNDASWWTTTNNDTNSTTNDQNDFGSNMKYKLRHIDSGEIAWWMTDNDNDDTVAEDITLNEPSEASDKTEPIGGKFKIRHVESGETAWWMTNDISDEAKPGEEENNTPLIVKQKYQIAHIPSGERAWWLNEEEAVKQPDKKIYAIRHVESGEKAWWMNGSDERSNDSTSYNQPANSGTTNNVEDWWTNTEKSKDKSPIKTEVQKEYKIRHVESGEKAWWMTNENDDTDCDEVDHLNVDAMKNCSLDCVEPPLGDRASPEGLEDTTKSRSSPYDHLTNGSGRVKNLKKLFISKHTNIDEILGSSCHPLSPVCHKQKLLCDLKFVFLNKTFFLTDARERRGEFIG